MSFENSTHQELIELAAAFDIYLREQLGLIDLYWTSRKLSAIHAIAHQLHGQGSMFGYTALSTVAGTLEHLIHSCLKRGTSNSKQEQRQISACISELKTSAGENEGLANLFDAITITEISTKEKACVPSSRKSILLVEDVDFTRRHIALSLRLAGYHVWEASTGAQGIEQALNQTPDLIVLDIKLPDIDGFAVQKKFRTHDDLLNVPLIILTALNRVRVSQIQTALAYGVTDYIPKPFDMDKLLRKIQTLLG